MHIITRIYRSKEEFDKRENKQENGVSEGFVKAYQDAYLRNENWEQDTNNTGCWNCSWCKNCVNCVNCCYCNTCNNCLECSDCVNCRKCKNCYCCDKCVNLSDSESQSLKNYSGINLGK